MSKSILVGLVALGLVACGSTEESAAPVDATQYEGTPSVPGEVPSAVAEATATAEAAAPAADAAAPVAEAPAAE